MFTHFFHIKLSFLILKEKSWINIDKNGHEYPAPLTILKVLIQKHVYKINNYVVGTKHPKLLIFFKRRISTPFKVRKNEYMAGYKNVFLKYYIAWTIQS